MVKCDTCPRFKDVYPDRRDPDGYPFGICGLTGNKVYRVPHRIKRLSGHGWLKFGVGSCGLYDTLEDALADMTDAEIRRWEENNAT